MRFGALAASIAIHAVMICALAWRSAPDSPHEESAPIYFEIVEEALTGEEQRAAAHESPPPQPDMPEMPERKDVSDIPAAPDIQESPPPPPALQSPPAQQQASPPMPLRESQPAPQPMPQPKPQTKPQPRPQPDAPPMAQDIGGDAVEHAAIVSPPSSLNRITPLYPRSARRKGREGCVTLEVRVSPHGDVMGAEILASSGFADLDRAAIDAATSARFAPATENDMPVEGRVRLTFNFKLK